MESLWVQPKNINPNHGQYHFYFCHEQEPFQKNQDVQMDNELQYGMLSKLFQPFHFCHDSQLLNPIESLPSTKIYSMAVS